MPITVNLNPQNQFAKIKTQEKMTHRDNLGLFDILNEATLAD